MFLGCATKIKKAAPTETVSHHKKRISERPVSPDSWGFDAQETLTFLFFRNFYRRPAVRDFQSEFV